MNQIRYQMQHALPVWFISWITSPLPDNRISIRIRGFLMSLFLPGRPKGLTLGRDVTLLGINQLTFGDRIYIAKGCWINGLGGVKIGDRVMIAPYAVITSTNHGFMHGKVVNGGTHYKFTLIGSDCWIAAHATVTAGAFLGDSSILAANSVLTGEATPNSLVAGVPGKVISERKDNPSK